MRHTTSLLAAGLAIALVATAAHAQLKKSVKAGEIIPGVIAAESLQDVMNERRDFQLICRGGTGLRVGISDVRNFDFVSIQIATMTVVFNHSTQPPDRTGRNLQPGQCSPANFQLRNFDAHEIRADIWSGESIGPKVVWGEGRPYAETAETNPSAKTIPEYLKDPNHYWSFSWVSAAGLAPGRLYGYFGVETSLYTGLVDSGYWKPEFYKGPAPPSTTHPTATTAAMVDRSTTTVQETSSRFGGLGAHTEGHAGAPAVPSPAPPAAPPPIVAVPAAVAFSPPLLQDGAQLWACVDAAAGEADPLACSGEQSAQAYCQLRDAQSGPELRIADTQPGIPVRAVNGDVCQNADACRVVSELQCDH